MCILNHVELVRVAEFASVTAVETRGRIDSKDSAGLKLPEKLG